MSATDRWQVISTPEAVRPATPLSGRPGEGSASAKRSPTRSSSRRSSSRRDRPRGRCGNFMRYMSFVPWGAILASAFLLTGIVLFAIHGKDASETSKQLFDMVSSGDTGYPKYFKSFDTNWIITIALSAGCIISSIFLALCRLDLKLRKDGSRRKDIWSPFRLNTTRFVGAFALLTLLATTAWLLLNGLLLTAWGWSMLTLRDASVPAIMEFNNYIKIDQTAEIAVLQPATNLLCPSRACLNLAYFSWLESSYCMCSQALIVSMQSSANAALNEVSWTLGGIGCLFIGALLGSVQGTADFVLFTADYDFLRATRKRSSSGSPVRRTYTDFLQTPTSMLKHQSSAGPGGYQIHARSQSGFIEK